jgi:acyl dehydratase
MPIYYPDILEQPPVTQDFSYGDKDVILYALGIGLGADPLNADELPFVYESELRVVPTAVTVLANAGSSRPSPAPGSPDGNPSLRASSLNFLMLVHGEHKIELHRPLPAHGSFSADTQTIGAYDKGKDKGALVIHETVWKDEDGQKVATTTMTNFARGDGGFGGPSHGAPEPHVTPTRAPDVSLDIATRPDQALIYRLNGDRNPLHADPDSARRSGFPRPILHGLCTYGITCRAVLQAMTGYDPEEIVSHQARFSAPVFPGDTLTIDLWRDGAEVSFEARVRERDAVVIRNGLTILRQ